MTNKKAPTDNITLPDPSSGQAAWIMDMYKLDSFISMYHYSVMPGTDDEKRLWMQEAARCLTNSYKHKILANKMLVINGENVNGYAISAYAKAFWKNGIEQNLSASEILNAWKGMASMMAEIKTDDEEDK